MNAADFAIEFLRTVERRDLPGAKAMMSRRPTIVFPRGATFDNLDACVADRSTRYKSIQKKIEGTHVVGGGGDQAVVYVFGTLEGVALDGSAIGGVRFIDRLTIQDGLIARHDVWNDLAL